jgi:hypothetical protein
MLIKIINLVVKIWDNHIPCFKGLQIIILLVATVLFEIDTDKVSTQYYTTQPGGSTLTVEIDL